MSDDKSKSKEVLLLELCAKYSFMLGVGTAIIMEYAPKEVFEKWCKTVSNTFYEKTEQDGV